MRRFCMLIAGCLLFLALGSEVEGQDRNRPIELSIVDTTMIQVIKVADGSTIIGRVVRVESDSVLVQMSGARTTLARSAIRSVTVRPASSIRNGKYWVENPNTSRLLFGPTGQMLKKGDGYVAAFQLVFLGGAAGVTDNFTMGGGILVPTLLDAYFVTPKLGFSPSPRVHIATGAMLIGLIDDAESIGLYYGATTFGDQNQSITGGIGYGFSGADVASKPVFMLGGEKRLSNRLAIVTENYLIPEIDPLIAVGVRFIGEKLSADIGLMRISDSGSPITIPLINFVAKF